MHQTSKKHMRRAIRRHVASLPAGRVLDVGSIGRHPHFRQMWEPLAWDYTGLDMIEGPNVDVVLDDPWVFPIEDNAFDAVISGQMLEHNEFFWLSFIEMNRVLKMGGIMIHIAPSRGHEHRAPQDCWRFYRDGMFALAKWSGFEVVEATTDWAPEHLEYFESSKKGRLKQIKQTMLFSGTDWGDCVGVFRKTEAVGDTTGLGYMKKIVAATEASKPAPKSVRAAAEAETSTISEMRKTKTAPQKKSQTTKVAAQQSAAKAPATKHQKKTSARKPA